MRAVQEQYEKHPYPPVGALALPARSQGEGLRYELGARLAGKENASHRGKRILVAGAGTLEALVVAQAHPMAAEVVAVDLSKASLARLSQRVRWARMRDALFTLGLRRLPPIDTRCGDLFALEPGRFDYIIATNVLHHNPDPTGLLKRLASWLEPGGILRLVTYPKASRIWMRATSDWFRLHDLDAESDRLRTLAEGLVAELPENHPIRVSFDSNPERTHESGLVDAYFHACENPLSPLQWQAAAEQAELKLVGETQTETSRSDFLTELFPPTQPLNPWGKLQIIDELLELCANPILWFCRKEDAPDGSSGAGEGRDTRQLAAYAKMPREGDAIALTKDVTPEFVAARVRSDPEQQFLLPSRVHCELGAGLRRVEALLHGVEIGIDEVMETLRREVGPRVTAPPTSKVLPGLSITHYPAGDLLGLPEPWSPGEWARLEALLGEAAILKMDPTLTVSAFVNRNLSAQAEFLHLYFGCSQSWIGPFGIEMA